MILLQADVPALQGVFASNAAAAEPEPTPEPVEQKPLKPPEPVSKWTLGDYGSDEDADAK